MQKNMFTSLKVLFAASVGGGLEMYDFVIYIFFAPTIAALFFPKDNTFLGMLATFTVFAVGYLIRPLGGVIFGYLGDKTGRKKWLVVSLLLMGIATLLIGCIPTYHQIGIAAPILLILLRMIQGIALGADMPGAITFVTEHSDAAHRGFNSSVVFCGVNVGLLLASFVATIVTNLCTPEQLLSWGWRIGFWLSAVLIVIGFYLRRGLPEAKVFLSVMEEKRIEKNPFTSLFKLENVPSLVIATVFIGFHSIIILQNFTLMPGFLHQYANTSMSVSLLLDTTSLLLFGLLIPPLGLLSDRFGRRNILLLSSGLWLVCAYPLYELLIMPTLLSKIIALLIIDILSALLISTVPVLLAELFKTSQRYSGVALTYNIGFAIGGGLTPLMVLLLGKSFNNSALVSLDIIVVAAICFLIALFGKSYIVNALRLSVTA